MAFIVSSLRKVVGRKQTDTSKVVGKALQETATEISLPTRSSVLQEVGLAKVSQDNYQFSEKLGEGTFAVIMSARCRKSGNNVAVKILKRAKDFDDILDNTMTYDDILDTFMGEIQCMEYLGAHPNIVSIHGKGSHFMVMESAKVDLYTIRRSAGTGLPLEMAKSWTQQILTGVAFVHKMGCVHQDLKSNNILVFEDHTAKLCDFGIARKDHGEKAMPVDREIVTLWYRAPELLMGTRSYTRAIDEWSVGCIALELLLGKVPFQGHYDSVCSCMSASHVNYNSDQLQRIFAVLGTPTDVEDLRGMACVKHFVDWPLIESRLWTTIQEALVCSESRVKVCRAMSDAEFQQNCGDWGDLVCNLLVLNPSKRITCDDALNLSIFTREHEAQSPHGTCFSAPSARSPLRVLADRDKSVLSAESMDQAKSSIAALDSSHAVLSGDAECTELTATEILTRASSVRSLVADEEIYERKKERKAAGRVTGKSFNVTDDSDLPGLDIGPMMT